MVFGFMSDHFSIQKSERKNGGVMNSADFLSENPCHAALSFRSGRLTGDAVSQLIYSINNISK